MYKIYYLEQFKTKFKKINRNSKTLGRKISNTIYSMASNPFHYKLNSHKLKTTQVKDIYTSKANRDLILVWKLESDKNKVTLITIRES